MGITDPYRAFCFDEACYTWGTYIIGEMEKIEGKSDKEVNRKRHLRLLKLLDAPDHLRFRTVKRPPEMVKGG